MDAKTKASINLHAVLRNVQELCDIDDAAKDVVKDKKITVKFSVKDCEPMALAFDSGKCTYLRGDALDGGAAKGALKLYFSSPEKFNKLVDGEKVTPIPSGAITKIGFALKEFSVLTDRLSHYLRPKPEEKDELLKDARYFEVNTTFLAYTAFHALAEIGNNDPVGREIAHRMPDGKINVEVKDGPAVGIAIKDGRMSVKIGSYENPSARMVFGNLQIVNDVLNGRTDVYSAMGAGLFAISGLIPLLDNMSKLLGSVARYLG
ncbi:MAG: hypothetical protein LBP79_01985 [Clostridiales bacterium]|jgi:hypothetical protein|nr:hypothetical protein [Clostridiales bacterium]